MTKFDSIVPNILQMNVAQAEMLQQLFGVDGVNADTHVHTWDWEAGASQVFAKMVVAYATANATPLQTNDNASHCWYVFELPGKKARARIVVHLSLEAYALASGQ